MGLQEKISILIVDDDKEFGQMVRQLLLPLGYPCSCASSANEALDLLGLSAFQVVISDIQMGGKDGLELTREAKEIHPELDFIIMTGHTAKYTYSDIIKAGASDFLPKPFNVPELEAKLRRIKREKSIQRELREANLEIRQAYQDLEKTLENAVETLARVVEIRDPYTAGHQLRVAGLAEAIAAKLGCSESQIESIKMAGLVHDIGKICVPIEILSKPSRLKEAEFQLIQDHSRTGFEILKGIDFKWPIAEIVFQHHEKINGSGYPNGLKGDEIRLESKILMVADVMEAISSHRPYRPALGIEKALLEIDSNRGVLYDGDVADAGSALIAEGFGF